MHWRTGDDGAAEVVGVRESDLVGVASLEPELKSCDCVLNGDGRLLREWGQVYE